MSDTTNINALAGLINQKSQIINTITTGMSQTIVGQQHLVQSLLIALLSNGHILLEGLPGLAKTLAIKTLASLIDARYNRIQFTPDLLPADIVGTMIYSVKNEQFIVKKGPVFANFILADEINRAPAKVQSALLQAMQERQITISDTTYDLPHPFLVMATQNPIEQEGTYPLPEAQVDRFLMKTIITYPTKQQEQQIIRQASQPAVAPKPLLTPDQIIDAQQTVSQIYLDEKIERYIVDITFATRNPQEANLKDLTDIIAWGASPRASISLAQAARAYAFINSRPYVIPEDIIAISHDILRHRIGLTYEAQANNITTDEIITEILDKVQVP